MKTIDANQLDQIIESDDDWILLDVLPEESYEKEHIPGAHNTPVHRPDFLERVAELVASREDPVVVYCASDECAASPRAARQLEDDGFTNVMDFEGGLDEWKRAGFEIVSEAPTTRAARQSDDR